MLNNKVAAVTGGFRGIGAAIAEKFASLGADVAIVGIGDMDEAEAVRRACESAGVRASVYECNVTDTDECRKTVKQITADLGGIDILVNNAGITRDNLILTMDEAEFDAVIDTNLKGCFNMIKACGRGFLKKRSGKIINIASVSGLIGIAGQCNYAASKAGVIALTKTAAREFASRGVCCNAIAPGFIMTDMTKDLKAADDYLKSIPLGRYGKPEEIANLAAFLADEASDYITGEVIRIDGGIAM